MYSLQDAHRNKHVIETWAAVDIAIISSYSSPQTQQLYIGLHECMCLALEVFSLLKERKLTVK